MATKTDEQRAAFEAWAVKERIAYRDEKHGLCFYNGQRHSYWIGYQAGQAALQSQDREDAERYRWLCDKFGITKLPCALERIIAGDVYVADGKAGIDEAIDHARRAEGDGE